MKRCILVVGMHRSGTSALTRVLSLLGTDLPNNLMPPVAGNNDLGFWESQDICSVNEGIFASVGSCWHDITNFPSAWFGSSDATQFKASVLEILYRDFQNSKLFVIKDPRICRLVPFWKSVLRDFGAFPVFLLPFRNPLEVAASLEKRDGFLTEKSLLLWLSYFLSAEKDTRGEIRSFISYDHLLDDWKAVVNKISTELKINFTNSLLLAETEIGEFLSTKYHRHKITYDEMMARKSVIDWVKEAFLWAKETENGKEPPTTRLDSVRNQMVLAEQAYGRLYILTEKKCTLVIEQNNELNQAVVDYNGQITTLNQTIVECDKHIAILNQTMAEFDGQITNLNKKLTERDRQIKSLNKTLAESEEQVNSLKQTISDIYASKSWKVTYPFRLGMQCLRYCYRLPKQGIRLLELGARCLYHRLPGSIHTRRRLKEVMFTRMPFVFRYTDTYKVWVTTQDNKKLASSPARSSIKLLSSANHSELFDDVPGGFVEYQEGTPISSKVKLLAFYLPQFHPIPENDCWWGKGFTEWTNVTRGKPRFAGHYQPHLPGELGFYDLRLPDIQRRQVELAKTYGIGGFVFYFYWFGGKRLLETPIRQYLENKEFDLPFCLCWANENWTRRWDGLDHEILIAQEHSPEDDIAFICHIAEYMADPRYIRVNGKPLLIIYRPNLLLDAKTTAKRWRDYCRQSGIGEIYLSYTQSFEAVNPKDYGFDAAIEFPPNNCAPPVITDQVQLTDPSFTGVVFDYRYFVERSRHYQKPAYSLFRGVCPSWDNEARRNGRGSTIFAYSSPTRYREWLSNAIVDTINRQADPEQRLVFINAWNEWAEGAHLEPDQKLGYAYLQATADALRLLSNPKSDIQEEKNSNLPVAAVKPKVAKSPWEWKILFVSHDANVGGAQAVLLDIISWFKKHTFINPKILCLNGGNWLHRFKKLGDTLVLSELREKNTSEETLFHEIKRFCGGSVDLVYCNSVASGKEYQLLNRLDIPIITHVHELEMSINRYAANWIKDIVVYSSHFIACSGAVRENLVANYGVKSSDVSVVYSSIDADGECRILADSDRRRLKEKLGLKENKFIIFGCGIGMPFRKGADLFIDVARALYRKVHKGFHLYWIGGFDEKEHDERYGLWANRLAVMRQDGIHKYVTFLGFKDNPKEYLKVGDLFLLPSREDPFPLVALEAAECGLPIVCYDDAGGMPEFVEEDAGFVVPYEDAEAMAEKIALLMDNENLRIRLGIRAKEKMLSKFTPENTVPFILSTCRNVAHKKPVVSVIIPNYNHARYLPKRLDSVFGQTFRDYEVILLDDASSDESVNILRKYSHIADVSIVENDHNSGSPFKQWLKGIDLARADILWIAESDDACESRFLETLIPAFRNPEVNLAYVNSHIINENDQITGDYISTEYLASLSKTKWKKSYEVTATQEINDGLGIKNTILNISAVLFKMFELNDDLRRTLEEMHIAGDWYFIINAIKGGKVHYHANKLNSHRRHSESVISKTIFEKQMGDFFREFYIVQELIFKNYEISSGFYGRLERYLRKQWSDFYPSRPFEELSTYYPIEQVRIKLTDNR